MPTETSESNELIQTQGQLHPAVDQEWLLTNGLGSFAAGTVAGCNTRRYHALLCAALTPPCGRVNLLSRVGEILIPSSTPDRMLEFSVNQFAGGNFHPRGDQYLRTFELEDVARWTYEVEKTRVTKELLLPWMKNTAGLRYTVEPPPGQSVEFRLLPFLAMRDFHALRRGVAPFDLKAMPSEVPGAAISVSADGHSLQLVSDIGNFHAQPDWWTNHFYAIEAARGMDCLEDLFNPGWFALRVDQKTTFTLWATAGDEPEKLNWDGELDHRRAASSATCRNAPKTPLQKRLFRAANDFIVARKSPNGADGSTIIAGYPWFADWGRDTMISLPGLLLLPGRFKQAAQVLSLFAEYVSEGMIPNRFDDYTNKPDYNTVDASLWFIHACHEYLSQSGDTATFQQCLLPACRQVIDGYRAGTRYNIKMDESDGLISQGDPTTQLTWMDAKTGDVAFTPRQGKPVEINALWYHALKLLKEETLAEKVAGSFRAAFWISPFRGLADVVDGQRKDNSIRPNQIFAVSLPHSPLTDEQQSAVVEVVRRELLTPMGLRTLARNDPNYKGRYAGNSWDRDSAYHNGTVWPWLIGPFLQAYLKVHHHSPDSLDQSRRWLMPLINEMHTACIGQLGEIYNGDPPQRQVGAFAQAWSVAEVLRLAAQLEM